MYFVKMGIVNVVIVVRKKKNTFVLLIIMILIMIIFMIIFAINHKKVDNMVLLPNFVGKDISEVKDFVSQNEIELNIEEEYSKTVEENKVVSQSVKEGTNIEEVKTISVVISKGKIKLETYRENGINEIGNIPVMMYHGIHNLKNSDTSYTGGNVDKDGYQRTSEAFRNDLEMYYQKGYRMIRLTDYIDGKIDVEFGKSPIVITFDDGLENNVKVTGLDEKGNIIIDPNSAVGILEEFKKKYPDYNITATFFVNSSLFNQPEYNDKILSWLIDNGYDIGNHSMNHPDFTKIDTSKTQEEIGGLYKILEDKSVNIEGIYSHIYDAENEERYKKQIKKYEELIKEIDLEKVKIYHISASEALVNYEKPKFINGCRLGIIMYGFTNNKELNLESTFKLKSEVIQINTLEEGETVGYGGMYRATEKTKVAVVPIGYADGIIRKNTGRDVFINNKRYSIVGNVCMDMMFVKVDDDVKVHDKVEVLRDIEHVEEVAKHLDTISYEIMCSIGKRVPRISK